MKRLVEISDEEIRRADWINAVDPVSGQWETTWGLEETEFNQANRHNSILNVSLTRNDYVGLLNLIDRVEQSRGRVSARVQSIRQILQLATAGEATPKARHVYSDQDLATVLD